MSTTHLALTFQPQKIAKARKEFLPLRLDRGLEELGKRRKEFTGGEGPLRAE